MPTILRSASHPGGDGRAPYHFCLTYNPCAAQPWVTHEYNEQARGTHTGVYTDNGVAALKSLLERMEARGIKDLMGPPHPYDLMGPERGDMQEWLQQYIVAHARSSCAAVRMRVGATMGIDFATAMVRTHTAGHNEVLLKQMLPGLNDMMRMLGLRDPQDADHIKVAERAFLRGALWAFGSLRQPVCDEIGAAVDSDAVIYRKLKREARGDV